VTYDVRVEVHKQLANGFRLKVSIPSIGMYVNGFRALPPRGDKDWWIIPPQQRIGSRWITMIEFDTHNDLWTEIHQVCIKAVQDFSGQSFEMTKEQHDKFMSDEIDKKFKELDDENNSSSAIPWMNEDD
jgi:hypothetical protein